MSSPGSTGSRPLRLLGIAAVLCLLAGGIYGYFYYANPTPEPPDARLSLRGYLQEREKYGKLAEGLVDANGDLLADAPTDGKYLDVKELVFTEVAGDDPEKLAQVWEPFRKHLEAKTGLPVKYLTQLDPPAMQPVNLPAPGGPNDPRDDQGERPTLPVLVQSYSQQIELMRAGRLHVAAFSTGQVPMAVNAAGFQPLFAPATAEGNFGYDMVVIVPADSSINDVKGLRGKQVAFVSLSSNSGAKVPIVRFHEKFGLRVVADYSYLPTGSHDRSILGVCVGREAAPLLANPRSSEEARAAALKNPGAKYDAACVASDVLARLVGSGTVKGDQYRVLHREGPFPALCFGIPHNLKPELAAQIKDAFASFSFEGNSVGDKYKGANQIKFLPVDYQKDWKIVREIDDSLPRAIEGK